MTKVLAKNGTFLFLFFFENLCHIYIYIISKYNWKKTYLDVGFKKINEILLLLFKVYVISEKNFMQRRFSIFFEVHFFPVFFSKNVLHFQKNLLQCTFLKKWCRFIKYFKTQFCSVFFPQNLPCFLKNLLNLNF